RAPAGPRRLRDYAPPVPRTPVSARYNGRAHLDLAPAKQWRIGSGSTAERLATPLNDLSTAYRETSAGAAAASQSARRKASAMSAACAAA
ncbi:hypothetical protein ACV35Q_32045, partial [Pseudomonas aeruginosa]